MKLSRIFSDGMVLQRHKRVTISGQTTPSNQVLLTFLNKTYETISADDGSWLIELYDLEPGGPFRMEIKACETIIIDDILIGDVWVLGGQSNMELPVRRTLDLFAEEMKAVNKPHIRQFSVPQIYDFNEPHEHLTGGRWRSAVGNDVMDFSAVGYFFATKLYDSDPVPIGLIQTAVGGTPIEAWISENTLRELGGYESELELNKNDYFVTTTKQQDEQRHTKWYEHLNRHDVGLQHTPWYSEQMDTSDWQELPLPNSWKDSELEPVRGAVWFRKEFDLPASMCEGEAQLKLGTIIDADDTYVNGTYIGTTAYRYPPRRYTIPSGVLKPGRNTITIRVISTQTTGGFIQDMPYQLKANGQELSLIGTWKYKIGVITNTLEPPTFFQYKPAGLYNGMIAPLQNYKIKGVLWYQGESNTAKPARYSQLFASLVRDWRHIWKQGDLPFLFTQLANLETDNEQDHWAILRDEQRRSLHIPHTSMAVTIDVGEYNDLHPQDKKSVGHRLALCAQYTAYGKDIIYSGPLYKMMERIDGAIKIAFDHVGSGLVAKGVELRGFSICGHDRRFVPAIATIIDNTVIVRHNHIKEPLHVRYAWSDNPTEANLYNVEGLPASPFTTED